MDSKTKILHLLSQLHTLDPERIKAIENLLPYASPVETEQIQEMLWDLVEKQNEVMAKIIRQDPGFPDRLNKYLKKEFTDIKAQCEIYEQQQADSIFESA